MFQHFRSPFFSVQTVLHSFQRTRFIGQALGNSCICPLKKRRWTSLIVDRQPLTRCLSPELEASFFFFRYARIGFPPLLSVLCARRCARLLLFSNRYHVAIHNLCLPSGCSTLKREGDQLFQRQFTRHPSFFSLFFFDIPFRLVHRNNMVASRHINGLNI